MKKILIAFLMSIISLGSITTPTLADISGTVIDEDSKEPLFPAAVQLYNGTEPIDGATTNEEGIFKFQNREWQEGYSLKISFLSYEITEMNSEPNANAPIKLKVSSKSLEDVDVVASKTKKGDPCTIYVQESQTEIQGTMQKTPQNTFACQPQNKNKYKLQPAEGWCVTEDTSVYCTEPNQSGNDSNIICLSKNKYASQCNIFEFDLQNESCPNDIIDNTAHAASGTINKFDKYTGNVTSCYITQCDNKNGDWRPSKDGTKCINHTCPCGEKFDEDTEQCVTDTENDCTDTAKEKNPGVEKAKKNCSTNRCEIQSCLKGWTKQWNKKDNEDTCVNQLDCLTWGKAQDTAQKTDKYKNATVASWDDDKHTTCIIMACDNMYRVDKNKNACVLKNTEDQEKLQANLDKAKANEKSLENRITGAVGIGGVGIGGMMIGGALSERSADDAAESDMRAYINTFMCDYGDGNTVRGGQTNVEIPGGNELIDLYARYARLANDLKLRKESLGIKPGIESEVIIDKASTGLYDDVGTGVVGGGYASIARAIMNPTGADAQMWAAQRAATTSKLNTGIGIATTAAALTLGKTIADEFTKPKEPFTINTPPQEKQTCEKYKLKGTYPACECNNPQKQYFIAGSFDGNVCYECPGDEIVYENETTHQKECGCPSDKPYGDNNKHKCYAKPLTCEERGYTTGAIPYLYYDANDECAPKCSNGFTYNEQYYTCKCDTTKGKYKINEQGNCVEVVTIDNSILRVEETERIPLPKSALSNNTLFTNNSAEFRDDGTESKKTIKDWVDEHIKKGGWYNCTITITGYADPTGKQVKHGSISNNQWLSEERAKTVAKYIEDELKKDPDYKEYFADQEIKTGGEGDGKCYCCEEDTQCNPKKHDPNNDGSNMKRCTPLEGNENAHITISKSYAPCRRVDIQANCFKMQKATTVTETPLNQQ